MNNLLEKFEQIAALSVFFFLFSCATSVSQKSSGIQEYQEDLSSYRPKYEDTASAANKEEAPKVFQATTKDVTPQVNQKLNQIATNAPKSGKGYRVLVYTGASRDEANAAKDKVELLTSEKVYMEYKAPNFRVKVGDAIDRLHANYLLGKLRPEISNAVIVPDEININY